jgi:hypothetical protein
MAGHRLSHPEQSMSRKVTSLSDFEYRVWEQTKLSSDDFGVMPYTSTILRADNLRLRKATEKLVFDALRRLVDLELLVVYDHQDEAYVCAPRWQDFQKVTFPRRSHHPVPPDEVLSQCSEPTRDLFTVHPGGCRLPKSTKRHSGSNPEFLQTKSGATLEPLQSGSEVTPNNFKPKDDDIPANANANANANAKGGGGGFDRPAPRRFDRTHASHLGEFCAFKCLSEEKIQQFAKDRPRGWDDPRNFDHVLDWARSVRDAWGEKPKVEAEWWEFWQARWAEHLATQREPAMSSVDRELEESRARRASLRRVSV